jgi:hypothetical protein
MTVALTRVDAAQLEVFQGFGRRLGLLGQVMS